MLRNSRRDFLATSAGTLTAASLAAPAAGSVQAPSDRVHLALVGAGGRGSGLVRSFAGISNVQVTHVSDPDEERARKTAASVGGQAKPVDDMRRIFDDKSVDAVVIATPDHWHAPAALLALAAGKHVYVEKPCSHNVREGQKLVQAARQHDRLVQHGTQSRSDSLVNLAIEMLRGGVIGPVLTAKAWNVQRRGSIGNAKPSDPPRGFDYDLWVGPAPMVPYQSNRHHYTWHWWYDFGTGDMGNDGVHELDIARWGLGVNRHPSHVSAVGGKLVFDDDQQFPDTQYVAFDYPARGDESRRQLIFEMRLWSRYGMDGVDNGNAFYGPGGWMLLSKRGILKVFDESNRPQPITEDRPQLPNHYQNFVDSIRGRGRLRAPIDEGHLSATLCHLGNISTRIGRSVEFDSATQRAAADAKADGLLGRTYRAGHWAAVS